MDTASNQERETHRMTTERLGNQRTETMREAQRLADQRSATQRENRNG